MNDYKRTFSKLGKKDLKSTQVSKNDVDELIDVDGLYGLEGSNPIFYAHMEAPNDLLWACKQIPFYNSPRTNNLATNASLFGAKPANPLKDNFCSQAIMASNNPEANEVFRSFGMEIAIVYKQIFPEIYEHNLAEINRKGKVILPEYTITETPFTSGVVNKENALAYHFDKGNFPGMQSAMIVLCKGVTGGHLVLPEYNVAFKIKNNTLILFDGQNVLHGVSPIRKSSPNGYRYSIVYYSMKDLWRCLTIEEEMDRYNKALEFELL